MTQVTPIGIQRIEKRLESIVPLLDMDDYQNRPDQRRAAGLSRTLAAYCVKSIGATTDEVAAKSVTDRFHDRGIDAIYYDSMGSRLLLVQSKWTTGIGWSESGEFIDGVRRLINPDWAAFAKNEKIYSRRNEIETALQSAAKIVLITVHHGPHPGETSVLTRIDEITNEIDGQSGLAESVHWHQKHLLESLQKESDPPKITADLYLSNWGQITEPYHAVFGRIQGQAIASLWKDHPHLSHMNLRDYKQRTDVNIAIGETVTNEPQHFWYFNNGLTLICESITPAVYGRLNSGLALFRFEGISLVNGAQTTGIVAEKLDSIPDSEKEKLWIQIRAIAVKNCPDDFEKRVTKFTNLQNAISIQDWVSLDPVQSRIATDFAIEKRMYAFRWGGAEDPVGERGCTLREATLALACAEQDLWYAVQAKREISSLWDTESPRYKKLFHGDLTATRIWNAVKIFRVVDSAIALCGQSGLEKADMVSYHLQRIVLHIVFQDPELAGWDTAKDPNQFVGEAASKATGVFDRIRAHTVKHNANEYLASLSKNFDKCRDLVRGVTTPPDPPGRQSGMLPFPDP